MATAFAGERPRRGVPLLAAAFLLPLVTAGLVNLGANWRAGPVSGMGLQTAVETVIIVAAAVIAARYPRRLLTLLAPFTLLLLWAVIRSISTPPSFEGVQNALVYLLFGAGVLLAGTLAARAPIPATERLAGGVACIEGVALLVVVANLVTWGLPRDGSWWVGPRSLAIVALIPFHWHLARWSAGRSRALLVALVWFAAILATTSRTASAIALVALAVVVALQVPRRRRRAATGMATLALVLATSGALVAFAPPIHARFFSGDTTFRVGSWAINGSGRMGFWRVMGESAREAPVLGHGLGSSQQVMAAQFLESDNIRHPHNDYLRLWHDLGLAGLALLLASLLLWGHTLARAWSRADRVGSGDAVVMLFALLTVLELLLAMVTDNILIYPFFMGAAGIVIGTALGVGIAARRAHA